MLDVKFYEIINDSALDFFIHHERIDRFETGMHSHTKAQLLYAEGGIVHVFIEDRHWYLPARCFMWIPANQAHSILSYSKNIELYNFYFEVESQEDVFYRETNIYFADDLLREMFLFTVKWQGAITKDQHSAYFFLQAIKHLLPELNTNKIPFSVQHPFPKDVRLIEVASYLLSNMDKNYTIEEIAKTFGLSVRTLSRKFKENLGMNYVRFLRSLRITKSLELIAENKYNMFEVAMLVGYSSESSFSNVFLKITGMRPTDYAKLISKE